MMINVSMLDYDILNRLNTIIDSIVKEKDLKIAFLALQALLNLTPIPKIEDKKLRNRIESFKEYMNEEDLVMLGIKETEKECFVNNVKIRLLEAIKKMEQISKNSELKRNYLEQNRILQATIKENHKILQNAKPKKTVLDTRHHLILEVHGPNNFPSNGFVGMFDLSNLEDSLILKYNYLTRKDIEELSICDFLFLEDPKNQQLIKNCLENYSKPLSLKEIKIALKQISFLRQKPFLIDLIVDNKIYFEECLLLNKKAWGHLYHLQELIAKKFITVNFILNFPEIATILTTHTEIYNLVAQGKIDQKILGELTEIELSTLANIYDYCFEKETFFQSPIEEVIQLLNTVAYLNIFQTKKFVIEKYFKEKPDAEVLKELFSKLGVNETSYTLIKLLRNKKISISRANSLNFSYLNIITSFYFSELLMMDKIKVHEIQNLSFTERLILEQPFAYYLYSNDLATLDQIFSEPIEFYQDFFNQDYSYFYYYLKNFHSSFEQLKDKEYVQQVCRAEVRRLVEEGTDINEVRGLDKFELNKRLLFVKLIQKKIIAETAIQSLYSNHILFDPILISLVRSHLISFASLQELDRISLKKLKNENICSLILSRHLSVETAIQLDPIEVHNLINCCYLIQKDWLTLEQALTLDPVESNYLAKDTIIRLIESGDITCENLPSRKILHLLDLPLVDLLIIEKHLSISQLIKFDLYETEILSNYDRLILVTKNIISFEEALDFSDEDIERLNSPGIIELIHLQELVKEEILTLSHEFFDLISEPQIINLIKHKKLNFSKFLELVNQKGFDNLTCSAIVRLIIEGHLTLERALKLNFSHLSILDTVEIETLIQHRIFQVDQILMLSKNQIKKLLIPNICDLICKRMIFVERVLNLTDEEYEFLHNFKLTKMISHQLITISEIFNHQSEINFLLNNQMLMDLFNERVLTLNHLKLLSRDSSYSCLNQSHICDLMLSKKLTLNRALALTDKQIRRLSLPVVMHKILYQKLSVEAALRSKKK